MGWGEEVKKSIRCKLFISTALLSLPAIAAATETVVYAYDALGRLTGSATTGTVNGGVQTSTSFDPAGNRAGYSVSGVGGVGTSPPSPPPPPPSPPSPSPPPPPPPPSPPPPTNQPPVAVADASLSVICNSQGVRNVLINDTDPEGDLPLSFAITGGTGESFVLKEGAQSIRFYAPETRGANYSVAYTVTDSRGASTNASLTLIVTGTLNQCGVGIDLRQRSDGGG